ncbi:cysteine hydrolase family protein [uncultured Ramlibacter sp.]|uniref:cysteine hydrolase family protein n=1 Tax=uncultured Ramlibacter sp. TaxID=260755 RepID=UPI002612AD75|nr:cysteine hydrolase family protein [uncultured Ramlibacter sp.]
MKSAVLVIDVQRAVCESAFAVQAVIVRINAVLRSARAAGAPVVFIQHASSDGPLERGSPGWELAPELDVQPADTVVGKTAADAFHGTVLQATLEVLAVRSLVICGLQSEFCVDTTTRRALGLGYPVTLLADGHTTADNGVLTAAQIIAHHNRTLADIRSFGPRVTLAPAHEIVFDGAAA